MHPLDFADTEQQEHDEDQHTRDTAASSNYEDQDEAADLVSPIVSTRGAERRSTPMVHYPSWSEVSDFDFSGDGGGDSKRETAQGWHPWRERKDGRYELA